MTISKSKMSSKKAENKKSSGGIPEDLQGITYDVTVNKAKSFDNGISLDLTVNGVRIYGAWYRTYEDRENPGDEKAFIAFPSRKGNNDKWYQHCWFPVSEKLLEDIEKQIEAML